MSQQFVFLLLNVPLIYQETFSLFISNSYPVFIPICVISVLVHFPFSRGLYLGFLDIDGSNF